MSASTNPLIDLLPAIHRIRDAEQGGPLRELLDVAASQLAALEENVDQLYDDHFIETCADWVVPYIGNLVGCRPLNFQAVGLSARAEAANTIRYRRRKGTAAMLEQLARDVTQWPAKAVEFFQLLATTQFMNHVRLHSTLAPDLRRWDQLEALDGPFDTLAHSADTRRIASGEGRHNIPNIGIFLWRLGAHSLKGSPAVPAAVGDTRRFLFSPLGCNAPLFTLPETEEEITHLAERLDVPDPIRRRRMSEFLASYYGPDKSVNIQNAPLKDVQVCNLADHAGSWAHTPPPPGKISIDPELGRIAFGDAQASPPLVTFHYGFSANMGGGEYSRSAAFDLPLTPVHPVAANGLIQNAIDNRIPGRAIQIIGNSRHFETLSININPGEHFELRAADERRPAIVLNGELVISGGGPGSEVSLNGLLLIGARVRVTAALDQLRFKHCALVPGLSVNVQGVPQQPGQPSLVIENGGVTAMIDHCVVGGVRWHDLSSLKISDSIVDAAGETGVALAGLGAPPPGQPPQAGGSLRAEDTTIIGKIRARIVELISNSILAARTEAGDNWPAPVLIERRQTGCIRFSYVPEKARAPRRFRCQPDLEIATRIEAAEREAQSKNEILTPAQREAIRAEVVSWLKPSFVSLRYGQPAYSQLRLRSPRQIREGADDESAMGAFHDVFEPQRMANARARIQEYLRFGLEAGIFTVT